MLPKSSNSTLRIKEFEIKKGCTFHELCDGDVWFITKLKHCTPESIAALAKTHEDILKPKKMDLDRKLYHFI